MKEKRLLPTVFLDRDGTLIEEKHYLCDPDQVELTPHAGEGLQKLVSAGYQLVMITNQSGIGRGYYTVAQMHSVHDRVAQLLKPFSVKFAGIFFCPHTPDEGCACRKPLTGMVEDASRALSVDLARSIVVGDKACDIGLAHAKGMKGWLVKTGHAHAYDFEKEPRPDGIAEDLLDLARQVTA